jgi:hypothetical protein
MTRSMRAGSVAVLAGVMALASTVTAAGQGATPLPLARATVAPDAAAKTLMKVQISADIARALVDACVASS